MNPLPKYDTATWDTIRRMHTLRLTDAQRSALLTNRERIAAMLRERTPGTTATPSECWSDGCAFFSYSLELPPEAWTKLRLHTYHFTGDNYQPYLWGEPAPLCGVWARQVADLPHSLRLSEPVGGIGFACEGRLISHDIVRFQHVVGTLHRQGVFELLARQPHPFTLEIGSGYGGLAYHLHRIVGRGTRVLLDLPETLLFAANYLTLHCPEARIYLYSSEDAATALAEPQAYDFILLPNFAWTGSRPGSSISRSMWNRCRKCAPTRSTSTWPSSPRRAGCSARGTRKATPANRRTGESIRPLAPLLPVGPSHGTTDSLQSAGARRRGARAPRRPREGGPEPDEDHPQMGLPTRRRVFLPPTLN